MPSASDLREDFSLKLAREHSNPFGATENSEKSSSSSDDDEDQKPGNVCDQLRIPQNN